MLECNSVGMAELPLFHFNYEDVDSVDFLIFNNVSIWQDIAFFFFILKSHLLSLIGQTVIKSSRSSSISFVPLWSLFKTCLVKEIICKVGSV